MPDHTPSPCSVRDRLGTRHNRITARHSLLRAGHNDSVLRTNHHHVLRTSCGNRVLRTSDNNRLLRTSNDDGVLRADRHGLLRTSNGLLRGTRFVRSTVVSLLRLAATTQHLAKLTGHGDILLTFSVSNRRGSFREPSDLSGTQKRVNSCSTMEFIDKTGRKH